MGEILNLEDEMRDMELGIEDPHRWDQNFKDDPLRLQALKLLGYTEDDFEVKTIYDFGPKDVPNEFKKDIDFYIQEKVTYYEKKRLDKICKIIKKRMEIVQQQQKKHTIRQQLQGLGNNLSMQSYPIDESIDQQFEQSAILNLSQTSIKVDPSFDNIMNRTQKRIMALKRKKQNDILSILACDQQMEELENKKKEAMAKYQMLEEQRNLRLSEQKKQFLRKKLISDQKRENLVQQMQIDSEILQLKYNEKCEYANQVRQKAIEDKIQNIHKEQAHFDYVRNQIVEIENKKNQTISLVEAQLMEKETRSSIVEERIRERQEKLAAENKFIQSEVKKKLQKRDEKYKKQNQILVQNRLKREQLLDKKRLELDQNLKQLQQSKAEEFHKKHQEALQKIKQMDVSEQFKQQYQQKNWQKELLIENLQKQKEQERLKHIRVETKKQQKIKNNLHKISQSMDLKSEKLKQEIEAEIIRANEVRIQNEFEQKRHFIRNHILEEEAKENLMRQERARQYQQEMLEIQLQQHEIKRQRFELKKQEIQQKRLKIERDLEKQQNKIKKDYEQSKVLIHSGNTKEIFESMQLYGKESASPVTKIDKIQESDHENGSEDENFKEDTFGSLKADNDLILDLKAVPVSKRYLYASNKYYLEQAKSMVDYLCVPEVQTFNNNQLQESLINKLNKKSKFRHKLIKETKNLDLN